MTYGPDAQPAIGWRSSERKRAIMKLHGRVSTYTREIRLCLLRLRLNPDDAMYRRYLPLAWFWHRLAQKQIRQLEGAE